MSQNPIFSFELHRRLVVKDPNGPTWTSVVGEGNKKALLIGINYIGQGKGELQGRISDANTVRKLIMARGFKDGRDNMRVLIDREGAGSATQPTRKNVIAGVLRKIDRGFYVQL